MRYIDSGFRDPNETLAAWLQTVLMPDVAELRWQSGFFNSEPLGLFATALQQMAIHDRPVNALIGSNDPGTLRDDVLQLVQMLGLPRANGRLGVVQYANGFFHPKTYHIRRRDGSQCAYVGSANLTGPGTALHVEAGLVLDSRDGDPNDVLNQIAARVDEWFTAPPAGLHLITSQADVDALVVAQVLALTATVWPPSTPTAGAAGSPADRGPASTPVASPRLRSLLNLPAVPAMGTHSQPVPPAAATAQAIAGPPVASRQGFPQHVLFAPNTTGPTSGLHALSGNSLPGGAVGLIIRLSRDDMRIFAGGVGTANISLPHESISTLRFGVLGRGGYPTRPRAEFDLHARYLGSHHHIVLPDPADTNVMLYGYLQGETGHQNTRMLLPADLRDLGAQILQAGLPLPAVGNLAMLEWPTAAASDFGLTFLEPGTPLAHNVQHLFATASNAHRLVGDGACWLPQGVSPAW